MIKFIVAALWISAVTVGAMMYSFNSTEAVVAPEEQPPLLGGLDYIKTEVISVPVIGKAGISGYFLARLVYTIEPEKAKKLSVPAQTLIGDELYSYLFSNPHIDFTHTDTLDLDLFRTDIRDRLNKRFGEEIVHDVIVEQIDFLSKDEIRDNNMRRRRAEAVAAAQVEGDKLLAPPDAHGESAGHGSEPAPDSGSGHGEAPASH